MKALKKSQQSIDDYGGLRRRGTAGHENHGQNGFFMHVLDVFYIVFDSLREGGAIARRIGSELAV